jgi:hypothetical protein
MKPSYLKYKTAETETVDISKLILENSIEFNEEKDLDELIDKIAMQNTCYWVKRLTELMNIIR